MKVSRRVTNIKEIMQIYAKAWSDEVFKQRLLSDTTAVMKEFGISEEMEPKFEVFEETADHAHFIISQKPDMELSDEELRKVSGGVDSWFIASCGSSGVAWAVGWCL